MIQARTLEKFISQSPEIAKETGIDPEDVKKVMEAMEERINKSRRHPREPAPRGSISLRAASRKYGISNAIISLWCKNGFVKILKRTANWLYIDENSLAEYLKNRNNHR